MRVGIVAGTTTRASELKDKLSIPTATCLSTYRKNSFGKGEKLDIILVDATADVTPDIYGTMANIVGPHGLIYRLEEM